MPPTQVTNEIASHLADKGDRYLMIYTGVTLVVLAISAIIYLVRALEKMNTKADSRMEQVISLAVSIQHTADDCRVALLASTDATKEATDATKEVKALLSLYSRQKG